MTDQEQVKSVFKPHHEEIKRRSQLLESTSENVNPSTFERREDGISSGDFKRHDQNFVLFSTSHEQMSPIATDSSNPGVRIYGTFETQEDAIDHAKMITEVDSCNIQLSKTHEWILAVSSPDKLTNEEYIKHKTDTMVRKYIAGLEVNRSEFEENVKNKEVNFESSDKNEEKNEVDASLYKNMKKATKLPRSLEVRDQSFCVVSFLPDIINKVPEFLFKVYTCESTQEDADRYVRNIAGDLVKDFNMDVVNTCEWLHPQSCIDGSKIKNEVFRSPELGKIMNMHKSQPEKVENFKRWREEVPKEALTSEAPEASSSSEMKDEKGLETLD